MSKITKEEREKSKRETAQEEVKALMDRFYVYLSKANDLTARVKRICDQYKLPLPAEIQAIEEQPKFVA